MAFEAQIVSIFIHLVDKVEYLHFDELNKLQINSIHIEVQISNFSLVVVIIVLLVAKKGQKM